MVVRARGERDVYVDSVKLMQVARALSERDGVEAADAVMATPANQDRLRDAGLLPADITASPNDVLLCVRAADEATAEAALEAGLVLLRQRAAETQPGTVASRSLAGAVARAPGATLAVISVPGAYAALEAEAALRAGLHVFLFSDNVALEDEVRLKTLADERGLLLMGPDCGTAIVGGVGLGFANAVRPGPVGIVGASGTGIQQVACLLDAAGVGLSHALGTGGRDLGAAVEGRTTRRALALLAADPATRVIVLVSKPPAPVVGEAVLQAAAATGKPVVACLLGAAPASVPAGITWAPTLAAAADAAAALAGPGPHGAATPEAGQAASGSSESRDAARPEAATAALVSSDLPGAARPRAGPADGDGDPDDVPPREEQSPAGAVRGLFAGGTLAQEALLVLRAALGGVDSNLDGSERGNSRHRLIDYGGDEYTVGRPHPMIDQSLRLQALAAAADDPSVGVVLLDVILGYGAHADPAAELGPAIERATAAAGAAGRSPRVVVSLCGTAGDPQGLAAQRARLVAAGAWVRARNLDAARLAAHLAGGGAAAEVTE